MHKRRGWLAPMCYLENLSTEPGERAEGAGTEADRWAGVGVKTCGISYQFCFSI